MKSKSLKMILIPCIAALCIEVLLFLLCLELNPLTPAGGTRLSILLSGYPLNAVTTKLEYHYNGEGFGYYMLTFPPYANETDNTLYQWNIEKHFIFYSAIYGVA